MQRKTSAAAVLALIFVLFLTFPHIGYMLYPESTRQFLQNRRLKPFPEFKSEALLNAAYWKEVSDAVWDHLPLRGMLLATDHWLDYHLLNDSPMPYRAVIGEGDWLYFYPALYSFPDDSHRTYPRLAELAHVLDRVGRKLNKRFLILLSPDKSAVYPEFMPEHARRYVEAFNTVRDGTIAMGKDSPTFLDLWTFFRENRLDPGLPLLAVPPQEVRVRYLWRPRDVHWDVKGGILQAKAIIQRLMGPDAWREIEMPPFEAYKTRASEFQMRRQIHLEIPERYIEPADAEHTWVMSVSKSKIRTFTLPPEPGLARSHAKVLVIHDSFFNISQHYVAPYFDELVTTHWNTVHKDYESFKRHAQDADIIIFQSIEWDWHFQLKRFEQVVKMFLDQAGMQE